VAGVLTKLTKLRKLTKLTKLTKLPAEGDIGQHVIISHPSIILPSPGVRQRVRTPGGGSGLPA